MLHAGVLSEARLGTPERDTQWCTLAEQMAVCSQGTVAQGFASFYQGFASFYCFPIMQATQLVHNLIHSEHRDDTSLSGLCTKEGERWVKQ